jgi:hypothetical protein
MLLSNRCQPETRISIDTGLKLKSRDTLIRTC